MSISDLPQIITRLKECDPESPIAIFKIPGKQDGKFESLFARTVLTKKRIKEKKPDFIGVFDKNSDLKKLKYKLHKLMHEDQINS